MNAFASLLRWRGISPTMVAAMSVERSGETESGRFYSGLDPRRRLDQPGTDVWEAAMSLHRWVRRLLTASCLWIVSCNAAASAEEIRDWPCELAFAERFQPAQVWGEDLSRPLPEGWRHDAAVREVVEFAANPENPPGQGTKRIAAFAAALRAEREERLMLVFAGLLDQFNLLRGFVIEGVRDFVLRAKILREAIDRNEAAVAALPTEAREEQRRAYLEARSSDARRMDDALEEAEFLCRRYGYLDKKLRELTAGVRAAL
jgi:hypothetical protein